MKSGYTGSHRATGRYVQICGLRVVLLWLSEFLLIPSGGVVNLTFRRDAFAGAIGFGDFMKGLASVTGLGSLAAVGAAVRKGNSAQLASVHDSAKLIILAANSDDYKRIPMRCTCGDVTDVVNRTVMEELEDYVNNGRLILVDSVAAGDVQYVILELWYRLCRKQIIINVPFEFPRIWRSNGAIEVWRALVATTRVMNMEMIFIGGNDSYKCLCCGTEIDRWCVLVGSGDMFSLLRANFMKMNGLVHEAPSTPDEETAAFDADLIFWLFCFVLLVACVYRWWVL
jgi:hypothetical protein